MQCRLGLKDSSRVEKRASPPCVSTLVSRFRCSSSERFLGRAANGKDNGNSKDNGNGRNNGSCKSNCKYNGNYKTRATARTSPIARATTRVTALGTSIRLGGSLLGRFLRFGGLVLWWL
jgi:hypothetical protein